MPDISPEPWLLFSDSDEMSRPMTWIYVLQGGRWIPARST